MRVVIAYDIAADRSRTRVAALLSEYGTRVQRSVFEADVSEADVREIVRRAAGWLDFGSDSLVVYPLHARALDHVVVVGRPRPSPSLPAFVVC